MKPPRRPRLIPARFLRLSPSPERPQRGPWGLREKRALLEALRAEAQRGLPEQRLAAALRERLPRRSEEEIRALLVRLRGRAAREALTSKFRNFLRFQRRVRAPIQVWQDLAETLVGGVLEGPPRAAFSQVLTLAATEPLTLDHSRPPQNSGTPPHLEPSQNSGTPPEVGTPQNSGSPQSRGGLQVDFGRIYEFLARISAGGEGPPLPPAEAAVVLSLLGGSRSQTGGSQSHFGDPSSNLGFPVPNWGGPSPTLGGPSSNWANPSPTLGLPVPNWGSQSHCWGSQSQTGRC
ncbi:snRNA-activating protein complex subunit 2 isoform X3 [Vidua chalybeata]|uniref:snRNA-activating protein complex subunit 2 isoform X3 n=1 Tax=Vidua chalybeata TaxID=81927 RepID=UPI0023A8B198|nr:snRNA-activating protein complex subunit 2 isoform X3 [Vidua chalybeata]